ncbi:uncharacterized protein BDW47DRAFT_470 [Aspergillus candidus]|uniref:Uncharacterized protein n=1 Tax=Aspergillus candidus TaxID=41067 RepID=A0A2I2FP72_ASPCN|nr:hypothetical protein BDW47DRAFT_470 [Aspergillus candidus]PLB42420.1 hypothetical protein BDW47DRAFT_470 [Aspergillus candidus]
MQWWLFERGRCMIYTMNDLWEAIYHFPFPFFYFQVYWVLYSFFYSLVLFFFLSFYFFLFLSWALLVSRAGDPRAIGGYRTSRGDCNRVGSSDSFFALFGCFLPDSLVQPIFHTRHDSIRETLDDHHARWWSHEHLDGITEEERREMRWQKRTANGQNEVPEKPNKKKKKSELMERRSGFRPRGPANDSRQFSRHCDMIPYG